MSVTSGKEMIEVWINGERREAPARISIQGLLENLEIRADRIAVELNKEIVRQRDWPATMIEPGSHMEIVEFVGGG